MVAVPEREFMTHVDANTENTVILCLIALLLALVLGGVTVRWIGRPLVALADQARQIQRGEFAPLLAWMREHVHQRGSILEPAALIEEATGSPPSPDAFVDYLRDKVELLYGIST